MKQILLLTTLLISAVLLPAGCVSHKASADKNNAPPDSSPTYRDDAGNPLYFQPGRPVPPSIQEVLDSAWTLLGKAPGSKVSVEGRTFRLDCIGTVAAIYQGAGIDLFSDLDPSVRSGGVRTLYSLLESHDALHRHRLPEPGDVVFWQHTYDANGDGAAGNDGITHTGIVVKVDKDGTVHYLHENYYLGVVVERMNLYRPSVHKDPETGKLLNSPMYDGSWYGNPDNPEKWLAGDLWLAFGGVLRALPETP